MATMAVSADTSVNTKPTKDQVAKETILNLKFDVYGLNYTGNVWSSWTTNLTVDTEGTGNGGTQGTLTEAGQLALNQMNLLMARVTAYEAASTAVKADPLYTTNKVGTLAINQVSTLPGNLAANFVAAAGITAATADLTVAGAASTTLVASNTLTNTTLLSKTEVAVVTIGVGTGTNTATALVFADIAGIDTLVANYKASVASAIARINQELTTGGTAGAGSH